MGYTRHPIHLLGFSSEAYYRHNRCNAPLAGFAPLPTPEGRKLGIDPRDVEINPRLRTVDPKPEPERIEIDPRLRAVDVDPQNAMRATSPWVWLILLLVLLVVTLPNVSK